LKTYPPTVGVADYVLINCSQGNSTTWLDLNGTRSIIVEQPGAQSAPTKWIKARNTDSIILRGHFDPYETQVSKYDLDVRSREGFSVQGMVGGFDAQVIKDRSLNRLLINRGIAAEIWDPRASGKITTGAGPVLQAVTGLIFGTSAGPTNAGIYPTFQASNALFGGHPTWTNVAGTSSTAGCLKATISNTVLPAGSVPGLIVVCRIPGATPATQHRLFYWTDGTDSIAVALASFLATDVAVGGNLNINGGPLDSASIKTADALSQGVVAAATMLFSDRHVRLSALSCNTPFLQCSGATSDFIENYPGTSGASSTLHMAGTILGALADPLEIAYVALLKRGMTEGEHRAALDLIALEWPTIERY
jgi:hypothetical protein